MTEAERCMQLAIARALYLLIAGKESPTHKQLVLQALDEAALLIEKAS